MSRNYGGLSPEQLVQQNNSVLTLHIPAELQYEGMCYERSMFYRECIQKGSVITFSLMGYSVQHNSNHYDLPMFIIPHSERYRGVVQWGYHTVYELNGVVYSFELENGWCFLKDYIKELQRLNNTKVHYRSEKQRVRNKRTNPLH